MKPYEVWEGDHFLYVSSWSDLGEASNEAECLNTTQDLGYFIRKINESGQYLDQSKW